MFYISTNLSTPNEKKFLLFVIKKENSRYSTTNKIKIT